MHGNTVSVRCHCQCQEKTAQSRLGMQIMSSASGSWVTRDSATLKPYISEAWTWRRSVQTRDRHENPTARLRAFLKEGFRLLCIVFYPFSPVCVAPAFLYISWPLSCHHSCLIGRAGVARVAAPERTCPAVDDNTASSVSRVNICCCCVQDSLSVALLQPQSTPTPALATRIISSSRKSFPLVSYYSFLHRLMMSQSIHKFVVVCRFEKFDVAAGCTGMKVLSGQTAKTWQQGRGDIRGKKQTSSA